VELLASVDGDTRLWSSGGTDQAADGIVELVQFRLRQPVGSRRLGLCRSWRPMVMYNSGNRDVQTGRSDFRPWHGPGMARSTSGRVGPGTMLNSLCRASPQAVPTAQARARGSISCQANLKGTWEFVMPVLPSARPPDRVPRRCIRERRETQAHQRLAVDPRRCQPANNPL
jgi:hypothetical protein